MAPEKQRARVVPLQWKHRRLPDEVGDKRVCRAVVDHFGRVQLYQFAVVNDRDPVGHRQRLALVMGHVNRCHAELAVQVLELDLHPFAEFLVQRRQRLVHQQNPRSEHECTCQRDALPLPTGQLIDVARAKPGELDRLQRLFDTRRTLRTGDAAQLQGKADVVRDIHVRKQGIALKHHAHFTLVRWRQNDLVFAKPDAAGVRAVEPGDRHQQRGLARTRRPKKREKLATMDIQINRIQRIDRAVSLGQISDLYR